MKLLSAVEGVVESKEREGAVDPYELGPADVLSECPLGRIAPYDCGGVMLALFGVR